ncbi:MAG: prenyltransferase [Candidatus Binatia bacterium]
MPIDGSPFACFPVVHSTMEHVFPLSDSLLARWWYAVKPQSWPKVLVSAVLGQALGIAATGVLSWRGALVGGLFTFCDLLYLVLLNDWGDREVDTIKRRMFPDGCSPKTVPDGILSAHHLLLAGIIAGTLGLVIAVLGGWWLGRPWLGPMGAAGLIIFQAYTFPPLRLNYRGGGELLEMLGVGILLPWLNAYAQSGLLIHPVFWLLPGSMLLSLASALASGLSDEESDRAGGKRTFTTLFGNPTVRLGTEVFLVLGVLAWGAASLRHGEIIPRWTVIPPAGIILWYGWKARAISAQAVTNAFTAQGLYKHYLHCAIWYGTVVLMCLLIASRAAEIE